MLVSKGRAGILACALIAAAGCAPALRGPSAGTVLAGGDPALGRSLTIRDLPGPGAPASAVSIEATCPRGALLVGGGVAAALAGGGKPPSSLHANGSFPDGQSWVGVGDTGGQPVLGGATTAVAVCLAGGPPSATVVVARADGPSASGTTARATAVCPVGTVVLGGGGVTGATSGGPGSPSLHLLGTFPSGTDGNPTSSGRQPAAWSATAAAGGRPGAGLHTIAYALCARWSGRRSIVARATVAGPLTPGGSAAAHVRCPAPATLLAGGALTGQQGGGVPQQGLHLTGTFPGDGPEPGSPTAVEGHVAAVWTARAEAGGQGSPAGTQTTALALCVTAS